MYKKATLSAAQACDDCACIFIWTAPRLAYALASEENDFRLDDITRFWSLLYRLHKGRSAFRGGAVIRNKAINGISATCQAERRMLAK
jgi:hypothetical protein